MNPLLKTLTFLLILISLVATVSAYKIGDINKNGQVTTDDSQIASNWAAGATDPIFGQKPTIGTELFCLADANENGNIDIADSLVIAQIEAATRNPIDKECAQACNFQFEISNNFILRHSSIGDYHLRYNSINTANTELTFFVKESEQNIEITYEPYIGSCTGSIGRGTLVLLGSTFTVTVGSNNKLDIKANNDGWQVLASNISPQSVSVTDLRGDANNDNQVSIADSLIVAQWSVGIGLDGLPVPIPNTKTFCKADVSGNGIIGPEDSQLIAEIAAGSRIAVAGKCKTDGTFEADEISEFQVMNIQASLVPKGNENFNIVITLKNIGRAGNAQITVVENQVTYLTRTESFVAGETKTLTLVVSGIDEGLHKDLMVRINTEISEELSRYFYSNTPNGWQAGDISQNGAVQITDAQVISHMSVGSIPVPTQNTAEFCLADANADGQITVLDANKISKIAAGLEEVTVQDCRNPNAVPAQSTTAQYLRGDANMDGQITTIDALKITQSINEDDFPQTLNEWCTFDANNDGFITTQDAEVVAREASGQSVINDKNCQHQDLGITNQGSIQMLIQLFRMLGLIA